MQVGSLLVRHFRASVSRGLALSVRQWATHTAAAEAGRLAPVIESLATRSSQTVTVPSRLLRCSSTRFCPCPSVLAMSHGD